MSDDLGAQAAHRIALGFAPVSNMPKLRDAEAVTHLRDADWRPLYSELLRIVARRRLPLASPARYEAYSRCLAGKALPDGFLKALAAAGGEHLTQAARDLLGALFSVLWRGGHDEASYELLKHLQLQYSEPQWLGIYLDALLATGRASQVTHQFGLVMRRKDITPKLEWAKIGMPRVVVACERLGVVSPLWHEDQGIDALLMALSKRPRPRLRSLVASNGGDASRRSA